MHARTEGMAPADASIIDSDSYWIDGYLPRDKYKTIRLDGLRIGTDSFWAVVGCNYLSH